MNIDKKVAVDTTPIPVPMMQSRITDMPPVMEKDDPVLHGVIPAEDFDVIVMDK